MKIRLMDRLQDIELSLNTRPEVLALVAVGSSANLERMDEYSDLDFFVVTQDTYKDAYIQDLSWLNSIMKPGFYFKNTKDGYKYFFEDGVYCEFAVFSESEFKEIGPQESRFVFNKNELSLPPTTSIIKKDIPESSFLIGEILTNLYVGLSRFYRGEKLSSFKFIQVYAVDNLLSLLGSAQDYYDTSRRVESSELLGRFTLDSFMQGYEKGPMSAICILDYLNNNFEIDAWIYSFISKMIKEN